MIVITNDENFCDLSIYYINFNLSTAWTLQLMQFDANVSNISNADYLMDRYDNKQSISSQIMYINDIKQFCEDKFNRTVLFIEKCCKNRPTLELRAIGFYNEDAKFKHNLYIGSHNYQ